jgi:hypothetical protein
LVQQARRTGTGTVPFARSKIIKLTPPELMEDVGTGLDYGTRPDQMPGYLVPNDRFYVRGHAPTPRVDTATWALRVEGDGVRRPVAYSYDELRNRFPLVSVVRTIECAGNRRVLLGKEFGHRFGGTQWGRGAIGTAASGLVICSSRPGSAPARARSCRSRWMRSGPGGRYR